MTRPVRLAPVFLALCASSLAAQEIIPLRPENFTHEGGRVDVVEHLGRTCLRLESTRAWLKDVELTNGIIEFDIAAPPIRCFSGVAWHVQDPKNYEYFYVRPHQTGFPDACQYTPVFNGASGWQLYYGPGFGEPITFVGDTWTPIRVVVSDGRAEISVGSGGPHVLVRELLLEAGSGGIGLVASNFAPAHFSNLRITHLDAAPLVGGEPAPLPALAGRVERWSVSSPFASDLLDGPTTLELETLGELSWQPLDSAVNGVTNLARLHGIDGPADTMLARVTIRSEFARSVPVRFGFSDRVRVYHQGRLLYAGDDDYRSRDHRFLGTVGPFDQLWLPLEAGDNELAFAVTEGFGGWGILASFTDREGIELVLPPRSPLPTGGD